jgi:hypothetical protein
MNATYRYPLFLRLMMIVGFCFFVYMAILSICKESLLIAGLFLLFALPCLYLFVIMVYEVRLSDLGIGTKFLGRESFIRWEDIAQIIGNSEGSLKLISIDQSVTLKVSSQVQGYPEVVAVIFNKRPDLRKFQGARVYHKTLSSVLYFSLLGLIILFAGVYFVLVERNVPALFLVFVGIAASSVAIFPVYKVTLSNNELVLQHLFWAKRFKPDDIEDIWFEETGNHQGISIYGVNVKPRNAKLIRLNQFREGDPVLFANIGAWLEQNKS